MILTHAIWSLVCFACLWGVCRPDLLMIRHGRSRVRHSSEKDHIRWGLKAFDNLTLDYEFDGMEQNDTNDIGGNQSLALNGSDLISQIYQPNLENGRLFGAGSGGAILDDDSFFTNNPRTQLQQQTQVKDEKDIISGPVTNTKNINGNSTLKKKLGKKEIMANIRKTVDKGLEYLKSHADLNESAIEISNDTFKIVDNRTKLPLPPPTVPTKSTTIQQIQQQQQQQTNYNEAENLFNKNKSDKKTQRENLSNNYYLDNNQRQRINGYNGDGMDLMMVSDPSSSPITRTTTTTTTSSSSTDQEPYNKDSADGDEKYDDHETYSKSDVKKVFYQSDSSDVESQVRPFSSNDGSDVKVEEKFKNKVLPNNIISNNDGNEIGNRSADFKLYDEMIMKMNSDDNNGDDNDNDGDDDDDDQKSGEIVSDTFNPSGLYSEDNDENTNGDEITNVGFETNDNGDLTGIYRMEDIDLKDLDETSRNNRLNLMKGRDVLTRFLQIVESQHLLGANCTAGTALNLGEGVVDRYAQERFKVEAEVAVNRANMLTRIFKHTSPDVQASVYLLHASVLSMVEFDDDIFAAGNCFDWNQHPIKKGLFCPFAYRLPPPDQGASLAKDLAAEYHYLGNTSEWFFLARKNAEKVIARNEQYIKAYHLYSNSTVRQAEEILSVKYEDGRWSKPYYDCGGGNIWMLTYTVPFFGYENGTYFFKGTSGIDIDLRRVDIDQCPQRITDTGTLPLNIFAGTDKCKQRTTECKPIDGLGFRRGSYKCICRKGFYFPDTSIEQKYFNGSTLEEEYEKLMLGEMTSYNNQLAYECFPCAEGCEACEDASPCVAALNWPMRTSILVMACAIIGLLPPAALFTFRYQQVKVVRAASPALLRVIALGAFFIYCTTVVMYPPPSIYTCTARVWLREIGFSLTYGALMLKTWRISVIFRVRSAKAIKITDASLLKRLGILCGAVGAFLLIRTIVAPPRVVVGRTTDDLKAYLCKTDWWDHTFTSMEVLFLAWGVRLCIMVRKAPSEFNESRFISMAIYNEFLLTCFLNVSMLFLQSPANPDLLFIIFFCHTQLTVTLLLALIFGSKVYLVFRGGGKPDDAIGMGAKTPGGKFICRSQARTIVNQSTATSSTAQLGHHGGANDTRLSEQEALEQIKQLCNELLRLQDRAPPRGVAVATITTLLEACRTSHPLTLRPPITNKIHEAIPPAHADKSTNTNTAGDEHWYQINNGGTRIAITDETDRDSINKLRKCLESCQTIAAASALEKSAKPFCKKRQLSEGTYNKSATLAGGVCSVSYGDDNFGISSDGDLSINADSKSCDLDFANLQLECMCSTDSITTSPTNRTTVECGSHATSSDPFNFDHLTRTSDCVKKSTDKCCVSSAKECDAPGAEQIHPEDVEELMEICSRDDLVLNAIKSVNNSNRITDHTKLSNLAISKSENFDNQHIVQQPILQETNKHRSVSNISSSIHPPANNTNEMTQVTTKSQDDTKLPSSPLADEKLSAKENTADDESDISKMDSTNSTKRTKQPETRLVLDLNDRSKYTKEVSV